jgi:hypothetical protein
MRSTCLLVLATGTAAAAPERDLDRDGFADATLGTQLFFGSAKGLVAARAPQSPRQSHMLFSSLEIVGDVNGDGFADVVVGDPNCPDTALDLGACKAGSIHLFLGGPKRLAGKPALTRTATAANTRFGMEVLAPGDLDGDRKADVVVRASDGIHIYLGTAAGLAARPITLRGAHAVAAGDIDGDQRADLLVLEPQAATLYYGGDFKRTLALPRPPVATFVTAGHGDFDGDGFGDLAITLAYQASDIPSPNEVLVYRGSKQGLVTTIVAARLAEGHLRAGFGSSFASVGDLDGDKRDDLVIDADCATFVASPPACEASTAYVYLGGAKGLVTKPVATLSPVRTNMSIVNRLEALGDVDGDKLADFVIGAFVYRGAKGGIANLKPPSL